MKKKDKPKQFNRSIKRQITFVFVAIMALTLLAVFLATSFLLERFYFRNKENTLLNVYKIIKTECESGDMNSDSFDITLQQNAGTHNVSIVLVSSSFDPLKFYASEPRDQLLREFVFNLSGDEIPVKRVVSQNDDYVMVMKADMRTKSDFLEMWGPLPDGSFFFMRTAVESIKNSADIAARFILFIGLAAALISAVVIYLFTRRISKPILNLADISNKMSEMDFETRYEGKDKTEIGLLGANINKMSANLESTISRLKEANIELKKDNDLKAEIDRQRTEFIGNVSHELKTPIALIQGYAEGLKDGVNEADERDYYCDVIIDEASKMNNMVKQLMTLNQLESGLDSLNIERFDIVSLVRNYIQSAEILARNNDIKVNMSDYSPIYVWADEFKIEEVIMNFFSNAVNHCESESEKHIDVTIEKVNNKVKVMVYNTGRKIPEESLPYLFDKFYKVDKARTREYGGSGVGLSIVKAIMDQHGEECGVVNSEDGVTFWFTLDGGEDSGGLLGE
ncbi:MAG: HAMP domain-containing histidine kinase [Lachnospiraceae bacterium]|nr:HAMP domain-containing histidine kinase [Lachnospiraceae bacterium]